jgi:serine/threonine protein kinase
MATVEQNLPEILNILGGNYIISTKAGDRFVPNEYRATVVVFEPISKNGPPERDENGLVKRKPDTERMLKAWQHWDNEDAEKHERKLEELIKLKHPNIVVIHKARSIDIGGVGYSGILMEKGDRDLEQEIEDPNAIFEETDCVEGIKQIADALDTMLQKNYVHRDIKTKNIIVFHIGDQVVYKICDFQTISNLSLGTTTHIDPVGTDTYMPYEQEKLTYNRQSTSDIYSLGLVFFQMLTKTRAKDFVTGNPQTWQALWRNRKRNPEILFKQIDLENKVDNRALQHIIKKMLAYDISKEHFITIMDGEIEKTEVDKTTPDRPWDDRYQTPKELKLDLELVQGHHHFENLYSSLAEISPDTEVNALKTAFASLEKERNSLNTTYTDKKNSWNESLQKFKGNKDRVYGQRLLRILNGEQETEVMKQMETDIDAKIKQALETIEQFVQEYDVPDGEDVLFFDRELVQGSLEKYDTFVALASKHGFMGKSFIEAKFVDLYMVDISDKLEEMREKYKGEGLELVDVEKIRNEANIQTKRDYYEARLTKAAEKKDEYIAKHTGDEKYKQRLAELPGKYQEYVEKVEQQKNILTLMEQDVKQRCIRTEFVYFDNHLPYQQSMAELDFKAKPNQELKALIGDKVPDYSGFDMVTKLRGQMDCCESIHTTANPN